jgi:hypothetical protein
MSEQIHSVKNAQGTTKVKSANSAVGSIVHALGADYERLKESIQGSCFGCCARNSEELCKELSSNNTTGNCAGVIFAKVVKETVSGRKDDAGKLRYSLIPPYALEQVAKCLTLGASKYAPDNWKYVDGAKERYLDALIRHTEAYRKGETVDTEGNDHLAAIAVNALFLSEFRYSTEFNKGVGK